MSGGDGDGDGDGEALNATTSSPTVWYGRRFFAEDVHTEVVVGVGILLAITIICTYCLYYKLCSARRFANTLRGDANPKVPGSGSASIAVDDAFANAKRDNMYTTGSDNDESDREETEGATSKAKTSTYETIELHQRD